MNHSSSTTADSTIQVHSYAYRLHAAALAADLAGYSGYAAALRYVLAKTYSPYYSNSTSPNSP